MDQHKFLMIVGLIQENNVASSLVIHKRNKPRIMNPFLLCLMAMNEQHYRNTLDDNWIDKYLEYDFFRLFRMNQETFYNLLNKIDCPELHKPYHGGGVPIPANLQLCMTLWWLGKGETLLSVSERFGVAISTIFHSTERILNRILSLMDKYIFWPSVEEIANIEYCFSERCGFPGVIGAIDSTNIKFKAPEMQQESYIDKNSNHSIKLQAIGTANKLFTNIFVGFPGSVHDNRVFRNSEIFIDIEDNMNIRKYFPLNEYHLVGDKAYPLLEWVMTPYRNPMNAEQTRYNTKHSRTRIVIEHLFGLLKGRWRILKYINTNSVEKSVKIIAACCILHNFCYFNADYWEEEENEIDGADAIEYIQLPYGEHNRAAEQKRFNISQQL